MTGDARVIDLDRGAALAAYSWQGAEGARVKLEGEGGGSKLVADLVAQAFIPNPHGFAHTSRLDGDVRNDRLENLSWGPVRLVSPDGAVERWADSDWAPYVVTDFGRVISKASGKVLDFSSTSTGARTVTSGIVSGGRLVGDLVAELFRLPNPHGLAHALHKNGVVTDDRLSNLTYSPSELESSLLHGERWVFYEAGDGGRLFVSDKGAFLSLESARYLTGDDANGSMVLPQKRRVKKIDIVARAFELENPYNVAHALPRDGDATNCSLENITYNPAEVSGMEGEWRPVPGYEGKYLLGTCGVFFNTTARRNPFESGRIANGGPFKAYKTLTGCGGVKMKRISEWMALTYPDLLGNNVFGARFPWNIDGDPSHNEISNLSWTLGPSPLWSELHEEWALLPGSGGRYIISNLGRVVSLDRGSLFNPRSLAAGKLVINLNSAGSNRRAKIAEAVATLFLPPSAEGQRLVHLNCDPCDNRAMNLRWTDGGERRWLVTEASRLGATMQEIASYHRMEIGEVAAILGAPAVAEESAAFYEGWKKSSRISKEVARNPRARAECLRIKGSRCVICNTDLSEVYGLDISPDVHHFDPLSEAAGERPVDPVKDLVPVCPNCHRALHAKPGGRQECYTLEELRAMMVGDDRDSKAA